MLETALVFLSFLALGVAGMAPSVTFGDAGEFAAAAATLGLPHAPSYPLYVVLAKALGAAVPLGNWAYRVALLSAVCGAAALALIARALREASFPAAARWSAVLLLGFSPLWRQQSGVPEVFALHAVLVAAVVWGLARWHGALWAPRPAAFLGLCFGLGVGNHHTIVLAAPAVAWAARRAPAERRAIARGLAWFAALAAVGLACYALLPLRSAQNPPLDWGDPTSWGRFVRVFLRKDYGSFSLTVAGRESAPFLASLARQTWKWLELSARGVGIPTLALAAAGLLWGRAAGFGRGAAAALALFLGPFFFVLGNPPDDALTTGALERFCLAPGIGLALLAAVAVERLAALMPRAAPALPALLALLAAPGVARGGSRADWAAHDYGRSVLKTLPPGAVLFMDGGDDTFYTLAFLTQAQGLRPDLSLHDRGGLVFKSAYGPDFRALRKDAKQARRLEVEAAVARGGRLYYSTLSDALLPGFRLIPTGLLRRVAPAGDASQARDLWELYPRRWERALLDRHIRDRSIAAFYPFMRAAAFADRGDWEGALLHWRWAQDVAPDALWLSDSLAHLMPRAAQAFYNLGAVHWKQKRWRQSAAALERAQALGHPAPDLPELAREARRRQAAGA